MAKVSTVFTLTDNMTPALQRISGGMDNLTTKIFNVNQAFSLFNSLVSMLRKVGDEIDNLTSRYIYQNEQETKLMTVMKQRMNATQSDIQYVKNLASAEQQLGVYGDEIILQGAQELATFASSKESIEALIPAMTNLVAQQYGYSASGEQMRATATMMGKVLSGQTSALSRLGYIFSEEEERMLKYGTEEEKAAALAQIITNNVGNMNEALANTPQGKIQQANNNLGDMQELVGMNLMGLKALATQIKTTFMTKVYEVFIKGIEWARTHITQLSNAVVILGTVVASVAAVMAVSWAVAHWPILLIISGIILIIKALNSLGVTTQEICGVIGGVLMTLYAFVYNNVYVPVYNLIATIAEFFVNVWNHPIAAVKQLIGNFVDTILNIVKPVVKLWDYLFGTDAAGAIERTRQAVQEWSAGEELYTIEKKQTLDVVEQANIGYEYGNSMGDKLTGMLESALASPEINIPELDIETAGDGSILVTDKNLINVAEDYRELLSKRATERFNLQFSQITPSISIDHVDVHKEADADNVLTTVVDALEEISNSNLSIR